MTKRVFILGAGFSKPAGFPLATDLTGEVLAHFQESAGEDHELFQFARDVQSVHEWIDNEGRMPKINIEEFYGYASIYAERLRLEQHRAVVGRTAGETPYQHADDLITWLSYLDARLLDVLIGCEERARLGPIERFVRALRPGDTIITFNYDRLVERCLSARGLPWSFGLQGSQSRGVTVLKVHGSLDWICFARDQRIKRPRVSSSRRGM